MSHLDAPKSAESDMQDASLALSREAVNQQIADLQRGNSQPSAAPELQIANLHQSQPCYSGFDLSKECIEERGLEPKVKEYERILADAMRTLNASYKVDLRVINSPAMGPYTTTPNADAWTDVVRDENMRNSSFIVSVTAKLLESKPKTLWESSAHHEICHIKNDDLTGYHRQGGNVEVAEEKCVLNAVGEERYREFLQAYATDKGHNQQWFDTFLQKVKNVELVPAPKESDDADKAAAEFFKNNPDGKEHLLVYNGKLHDISLASTGNGVEHDPQRLSELIREGKPMVFIHNHPDAGRPAMFPSADDYGVAALFLYQVYSENPNLNVEFRVQKPGDESSTVAYGLKGTAVEDIRKLAAENREATAQKQDVAPIEFKSTALANRLRGESFTEYLQNACPVDLSSKNPEICRTHPQYFLWPSSKFFLRERPQ